MRERQDDHATKSRRPSGLAIGTAFLVIGAVGGLSVYVAGGLDGTKPVASPSAQGNVGATPSASSPGSPRLPGGLSSSPGPSSATPTRAPVLVAASLPKLVLPAGTITPSKAPHADPSVVAAIKASPNADRWDANYLALIDQAARTHDTSALNHLLGCAQRSGCSKADALWSAAGVMDQIPVLLEKATLAQGSGSATATATAMVPSLGLAASQGAATSTHPAIAAEEKLFGITYPTQYRGLNLGFDVVVPSGGDASKDGYLRWSSASLAQAPASTARLASYAAGTVTTKHAPRADAKYVSEIQKYLDDTTSVEKHLPGTVNLLALIDEAAQLDDIDALVKLCGNCASQGATPTFVATLTATDHPGGMGHFDQLVAAVKTHGAPDNAASLDFPGFGNLTTTNGTPTSADRTDFRTLGVSSAAEYTGLRVVINVDDGPNASGAGMWFGQLS